MSQTRVITCENWLPENYTIIQFDVWWQVCIRLYCPYMDSNDSEHAALRRGSEETAPFHEVEFFFV